ncbi:MAG TPA: hypothetical protein VM165_10625, partial [Planctomycetaceae bacterium]|nr:hypothetical protein [Planctomycetaceae bacterium]
MQSIIRKIWDVPQRLVTDESVYRNRRWYRREFLRAMGLGGMGLALTGAAGCAQKPSAAEIDAAGAVNL